ncbi:ABC transporter substrate-binding protein [Marinomonas transparens]|uniref:Carbohydrate ABC transporter substrate-binding protein n=1 Tax=Marinomonas transparens TaxID=2795388 RepID=A0A934JS22_9GAMM|nr:ABC transporter substrate-binding protein [Marinomonas transparens]MBJ7537246.1 carbohydrate ABC transporter substrate-binding protein [Marinomonas transparens]
MKIKTIALLVGMASIGSMISVNASADELRMSWWGGNSRHKATNAAVDEFEKANPSIEVKTEYTGWGGHLQRLTTQIAGNTEPDVMQTNWNWMPIFSAKGNGFKDLREYADVLDLTQFDESALAAGTNNGKLNAIPISMAARVFYFNKDTWAKVGLRFPTNWDEIMAAGPIFKEKLGDNYFPLILETNDLLGMARSYMVQKYGIGMIDEAGEKLAYSDAQILEFFKLYTNMVDNHVIPSTKYIASFGAANMYEHKPWIDGEWGGIYMWNSAVNKYNNNLKPPMSLGLGFYPQLPGATDAGLFYKPAQMFSIGKNSDKPREAAMLINFILNEPAGYKAMGLARGVPLSLAARRALALDGTISDTDLSVAGLAQINDLPKNIKVSPYFENPKLVSLFKGLIEKMDQGQMTVEEVAKDYKKQANRILRKAIK